MRPKRPSPNQFYSYSNTYVLNAARSLSSLYTLYLSQALRLRAEFPVRSNPPFLLPFGDFGAGGALISGGGVVAGLVVAFAAAEKMPVTGRCTFELVVLAAAAGGGGGGGGEACRLATGGLPSEIFAMGTPPPPMLLVLLVSPTLLAVCAGVGTSPNSAHTLYVQTPPPGLSLTAR